MTYIKWGFWGLFWLILAMFLHYTLPQRDVVRITDTYSKIMQTEYPLFWSHTGDVKKNAMGRDVFLIEARYPDGDPIIYRNEDTGWGWPPYFKFDTTNLQADARDLVSTKEKPQWVVIRHYGWRNEFLSIFPNAISVRPVADPNVRLIPWFNIIFLTVMFGLFWAIRVRWKRFWSGQHDDSKAGW